MENNSKTLTVDIGSDLKEKFKSLCKKHKTTYTSAIKNFAEICVINNINPEEIDMLINTSAKGSITKYHNHTASFLKTFEATLLNRLELYNSITVGLLEKNNEILKSILIKNNIEKQTINEILFNTQLLINEYNEELGKFVFEKNTNSILKNESKFLDKP